MLGITLLAVSAFVGTALSIPAQVQSSVIDGVEWSVTDFSRECTTYPSSCLYDFIIVAGEYIPDSTCTINDTSSDPVHNSLASVPCGDAYGDQTLRQWTISWGYNAAYDFAVMTVVSEAKQQDAWFGYKNVSTTTFFEDVGPNKVYALGTFA